MIVTANITYRQDTCWLWKKGDIAEIKMASIDFCCDEAKEAFESNFIGFGEYDGMLNQSKTMNIYHCSPYPEGAFFDEMPINSCPFCGRLIEIRLSNNACSGQEPA